MTKSLKRAGQVAAIAASLTLATAAWGNAQADRHRNAIEQARTGQYAPALLQLGSLLSTHPEDLHIAADYITVLHWAGHHAEAVRLAEKQERESMPAYALMAAGDASVRIHRPEQARRFYRLAQSKAEDDPGPYLAEARSWAAEGNLEACVETVGRIPNTPPSPATFAMLGKCYASGGLHAEALGAVDRGLAQYPGNSQLQTERAHLVIRLGAPAVLAAEAADPDEGQIADVVAQYVRWGTLPTRDPANRFRDTDRALQLAAAALASATHDDASRIRLDVVVALRNRYRMSDAIQAYKILGIPPEKTPPYVLKAVGDAHQYLQHPKEALQYYDAALRQRPDDAELMLARLYVLSDLGAYGDAIATADRMVEAEPIWKKQAGPRKAPNPGRLQAESAAAMMRAFADMTGEANERLEDLWRRAPHNAQLSEQLATIYLWRGWPRRAQRQYELTLGIESENIHARTGRVHALLSSAQYETAAMDIRQLTGVYPEHPSVQHLLRTWNLHNRPLLQLNADAARQSGSQLGGREQRIEAVLYSSPWRYRYRAIAKDSYESASFEEGDIALKRLGGGAEYTGSHWKWSAIATRNSFGQVIYGAEARTEWRPNDQMSWEAGFDTESPQVPLRARLHGMRGKSAFMSAAYRYSDAFSAGGSVQQTRISDGNVRTSATLSLNGQLVPAPGSQLHLGLDLYQARSTRDATPYFSPRRDHSIDFSVSVRTLLKQDGANTLHHRIGMTIGSYGQAEYPAGTTGALRYEQEWRFARKVDAAYGARRYRNWFDGKAEYGTQLYLALNWRLE